MGLFPNPFSRPAPTNAELQAQRRRANQGPSVAEAQKAAEGAQSFAEQIVLVGMTMGWAGQNDPPGGKWLVCDGRLLDASSYPALFAAIGAAWNVGGEGAGTFRLPDCRGRALVGAGQGSGLTNRALGARFGTETHTLTVSQMPSHDHAYTRVSGWNNQTVQSGTGASVMDSLNTEISDTGNNTHAHNIPLQGGGAAHPNTPPSLVANFVIRVLP